MVPREGDRPPLCKQQVKTALVVITLRKEKGRIPLAYLLIFRSWDGEGRLVV